MLSVTPISAFSDNYIWCLRREGEHEAWVVDPGDAKPVLSALDQAGLSLAGILVTHHHFDHTGGISDLLSHREVPVYGPRNPVIEQVTLRLAEGDTVEVLGEEFRVLEVPGHTLDHIAFVSDGTPPLLFCGDTLFAGGCGRLFEGDPPMMLESLSKLASLPGDTRVFCAHEYTLANLAFARAVEPDNPALRERESTESAKRERDQPTVPSSVSLELATNPFLRCGQADVARAAARRDGVDPGDEIAVFASVRGWKDNF